MRICSAIQKRTNNKRIKYFGRSENFVAEPLTLSNRPIVAWFDRFEFSRFQRRHSLVADERVVRISPIGQVSLRFGTFLRWNVMQ